MIRASCKANLSPRDRLNQRGYLCFNSRLADFWFRFSVSPKIGQTVGYANICRPFIRYLNKTKLKLEILPTGGTYKIFKLDFFKLDFNVWLSFSSERPKSKQNRKLWFRLIVRSWSLTSLIYWSLKLRGRSRNQFRPRYSSYLKTANESISIFFIVMVRGQSCCLIENNWIGDWFYSYINRFSRTQWV